MTATTAGVLTNIFTAPQAAFAAIKERPSPWLPLLFFMIGTFVVQFMYMQLVDLPWLFDHQLQQAGGGMTEAQREQTVDMMTQLPPTALGAMQGASGAIAIPIIYALFALYYTGVSFARNDGHKFKQWFALIAWCSLPGVLGLIASLVNLQVADARFLPAEQINPLSFGSLLALDPEGATIVERILMALDVTVFWALALQILGYQAFTQRSTVTSAIVVLAPYAVISLIAYLFTLT
jgi:hypothetical protein